MATLVSIEAYKKAESEVAKLENSKRYRASERDRYGVYCRRESRSALSVSTGVKQAVRVSSCPRKDRVWGLDRIELGRDIYRGILSKGVFDPLYLLVSGHSGLRESTLARGRIKVWGLGTIGEFCRQLNRSIGGEREKEDEGTAYTLTCAFLSQKEFLPSSRTF